MKLSDHFRLLAIGLLGVSLLMSVPSAQAAVSFDSGGNFLQNLIDKIKDRVEAIEKEREKDKKRDKQGSGDKPAQVPEGEAAAFLILAAASLGGGILVWRRKQHTDVV